MNKQEFLQALKARLSEYPKEEIMKSIGYYSEMLEDRIEDGMSEEEAVASLGSVDAIAEQIKCELPMGTLIRHKTKERTKDRRIPIWAIVLLVIGSPLWIGIVALLFGLFIMVYALVWTADLMLWAADLMLGCGVLCGIAGFALSLTKLAAGSSLIYLGGILTCGGLGIFLFFGSRAVTKGILYGTKQSYLGIKRALVGKTAKEA